MPEAVRFDSECSVPGWRLVKDLDRCGLDREIREAGGTFFCLVKSERLSSVLTKKRWSAGQSRKILARLKSEKFNSLEITRVASEASKRFLGVRYVTVSAKSRHIQGPARSAAA